MWLPRGQLRIVPYTRRIQKMADKGVIVILARRPVALSSSEVSDA